MEKPATRAVAPEARFNSSEARRAFALLKREAEAVGLRFHYKSSLAAAVEFVEVDGAKPFSAIANDAHLLFYLRQPILRRIPGLFDRATERFGAVKANRLNEYRTPIRSPAEMAALLEWLRAEGAWGSIINGFPVPELRNDGCLPAAMLEAVTADHLLVAARLLAGGYDDHEYGETTIYEVAFEGVRLKPKALFGVAASRTLGFRVKPSHFSGGVKTQCFRKIRAAGYSIIAAGAKLPPVAPRLTDEDKRWAEGSRRLIKHLQRERGHGLAAAKRDQFRVLNGRLFCEKCGLDPVEHFRHEDGEAAIEVHHRATAVADMAPDHQTALEDLECLCANCHRVVHRAMKREARTWREQSARRE